MKKTLTLALTLPALALLAGCGGNKADVDTNTTMTNTGTMTDITTETDNGTMNASVAAPAMTGQEFANTAASTDAYEIAAGKLAQTKATSQALKDFGKMMVEHHNASTEKLKAAAAKASPAITPNPALTAEQETNLSALRNAEGAAFDTLYKTQQVAAHEKALATVKAYAASGDVPELKTFAGEAEKVVSAHLAKIKGL